MDYENLRRTVERKEKKPSTLYSTHRFQNPSTTTVKKCLNIGTLIKRTLEQRYTDWQEKINRSIIKINKENWEGELTKLGDTDISKAPREFYTTIKKLSGSGRSSSGIKKMLYNGRAENTEEGIANLMALYTQDSFKPLDDEDIDYNYFQKITDEVESAQEALNQAKGELTTNINEKEDTFTWNPKSSNIHNKMHKDTEEEILHICKLYTLI